MKFSKGDVICLEGLGYPEGAMVCDGYDNAGRLLAHPLGGGFQLALRADAEERFRVADAGERARALFRRAKFSLMDSEEHFTGWTNGESWNGWVMPHFEFEEAQRLIAWLKEQRAHLNRPADTFSPSDAEKERHDAGRDVFLTFNEDDEEETWAGCSIPISDGSRIKVYGIGAGCWCWDEVAERRLA